MKTGLTPDIDSTHPFEQQQQQPAKRLKTVNVIGSEKKCDIEKRANIRDSLCRESAVVNVAFKISLQSNFTLAHSKSTLDMYGSNDSALLLTEKIKACHACDKNRGFDNSDSTKNLTQHYLSAPGKDLPGDVQLCILSYLDEQTCSKFAVTSFRWFHFIQRKGNLPHHVRIETSTALHRFKLSRFRPRIIQLSCALLELFPAASEYAHFIHSQNECNGGCGYVSEWKGYIISCFKLSDALIRRTLENTMKCPRVLALFDACKEKDKERMKRLEKKGINSSIPSRPSMWKELRIALRRTKNCKILNMRVRVSHFQEISDFCGQLLRSYAQNTDLLESVYIFLFVHQNDIKGALSHTMRSPEKKTELYMLLDSCHSLRRVTIHLSQGIPACDMRRLFNPHLLNGAWKARYKGRRIPCPYRKPTLRSYKIRRVNSYLSILK